MSSFKMGKEIQKSKKSKKENLREKIKRQLHTRKEVLQQKEKASSNFPASSVNGKRTVTRILRHSTSSFEDKPLVAFDWSLKSRKPHRHSSSCGQSEKIKGKIFFCKEYYIWDCTHNILNFNKYFVRIIFIIVLLTS